jgi:hypothetical protein
MRLSSKYAPLIFSITMSAMMSLVMSFAMTVINAGVGPGFVRLWLDGFLIGFAVATPVAFGAVPIAGKVVHWLTYNEPARE